MKKKIIAGVVLAAVLAFAFWWGGGAPGLRGWNIQSDKINIEKTNTPSPSKIPKPTPSQSEKPSNTPSATVTSSPPAKATETAKPTAEKTTVKNTPKKADEPAVEENRPQNEDNTPMTAEEKLEWAEEIADSSEEYTEVGDEEYSRENGMEILEDTGLDQYQTEPVPEGRPVPIEPQETVISDKEMTCTLSVSCDTILRNMAWLDSEKRELVPQDGIIFPEQTVTFYEGESVFNLLVREMKKNKIHMEFENTPIYNSAYIEGIGNLYEFDCGELSGWMYKVNGYFPNYGCSRYQLKEGDRVEWVYTCDLGIDVGGHYSSKNGR